MINDRQIELIALGSILAGIILAYIFVFDNEPIDAFFLAADDNNVFLDAVVLETSEDKGSAFVYGCREFMVYSDIPITKNQQEWILLSGRFSNGNLIAENYK